MNNNESRIIKENAEFADEKIHEIFSVKCSKCKKLVFINTITKNIDDYYFYCINCNTFVEDEIIELIKKKMISKTNIK